MTYYVYIIYSETINQYYVGQTQNIEERLQQHRNSRSKSTKKANDWVLVYSEIFPSRADAVKRESEIKKMKSRKYIEGLINKIWILLARASRCFASGRWSVLPIHRNDILHKIMPQP